RSRSQAYDQLRYLKTDIEKVADTFRIAKIHIDHYRQNRGSWRLRVLMFGRNAFYSYPWLLGLIIEPPLGTDKVRIRIVGVGSTVVSNGRLIPDIVIVSCIPGRHFNVPAEIQINAAQRRGEV